MIWLVAPLPSPPPFVFNAVGNAAWTLDVHCFVASELFDTDVMVTVPLAHLTQSYSTPVWLVLLMHFLPLLPFLLVLFPKPPFRADCSSFAFDDSPSCPDFLFSLPLYSLYPSLPVFSPFPFPPFLSVTCSYWSLLLTGGLWLVLAIFFFLSAWVHSAPAASVSSCLILIPVCESLALHFLPSPQKWLFFPFICVCVCVFNSMLPVSSLLYPILSF